MDPTSFLLTSVLFVGAAVAKKPTDELADLVWSQVKKALAKVLGREPAPGDVTAAVIEKAATQNPAFVKELGAIPGHWPALRRAARAESTIQGSRLLWIDDHPENNAWERRLFEALGAAVRTVETTRSAVAMLQVERFDVVLSDISRGGSPKEGIDAISALREVAPQTPILFYVGELLSSAPPAGAQGITDEPNELLHLVLDRLERTRV